MCVTHLHVFYTVKDKLYFEGDNHAFILRLYHIYAKVLFCVNTYVRSVCDKTSVQFCTSVYFVHVCSPALI